MTLQRHPADRPLLSHPRRTGFRDAFFSHDFGKVQVLSRSSLKIQPKLDDTTESGPTVSETSADQESEPSELIVEDGSPVLNPGQMRKIDFLDELQTSVCNAADAELAAAGRSTEGCPLVERWFEYYRSRSAQQIERALKRYAPEAAGAASAREYIPVVSERVRSAVATWAATGEITGIPERISTAMPEAGAAEESGGEVSTSGALQRKGSGVRPERGSASAIQSQLGTGQALDTRVKSRMESALGYDFSHVRVHTDKSAAELSNSFSARAFTIGSEIAFGSGEYQPDTLVGDALIAHELAHVIQQGGGGATAGPLNMSENGENALEEEADQSAIGAVISLWSDAKGALADISRNAMPRLRSGLRLSRCKDGDQPKPSEQAKPEGKKEGSAESKPVGVTHAADFKCEPEPKPWNEITSTPGLGAGTLGHTKAAKVAFELSISPQGGKCKTTLGKEPRLSFTSLVYTKPGDYSVGTVQIPDNDAFKPCKGKTADYYFRFTPQMSEKIKQGEIEHCEDQKRAFALSYERYAQAAKGLAASEFPGTDQAACQTEGFKRLKETTGIDVSQWAAVGQCLFDKTLVRDNAWHKATTDPAYVTFVLSPDCKRLTLVFDHTKQLLEINKHKTEDVVKGCGEPQP